MKNQGGGDGQGELLEKCGLGGRWNAEYRRQRTDSAGPRFGEGR